MVWAVALWVVLRVIAESVWGNSSPFIEFKASLFFAHGDVNSIAGRPLFEVGFFISSPIWSMN